jgi:hypothetical protein
LALGLELRKRGQHNPHKLTLGLKGLWLGKSLYLLGLKIDSRVRTANLLQDATSAEPKPGVFAIVREIRARSGNVTLQTYTPTAIAGGCLVSEGLQTSRQA